MMKMPFDFRAWVFLVNGVPLEGFAPGDDAFQMERTNDSISDEVGVTGEMSAYIAADRSGTITMKFAANSSSNTYLGTLMDLEEGGYLTFVPIRFEAKDQALQDAGAGTVGYLTKPAMIQRGQKAEPQEWKIKVERLDLVFGGAAVFPL